ncbi:hypothetical protein SDC9_134244 [bioreactor metagenome]|uniref:GyrI-like small molecule binding domain-containing protein n=1 Tax=bioreactor metagenome TaxID=1076179 RepID=A0A645DCD7_9ZZZZ
MDFKKEFKALYLPKTAPSVIDVPTIPFFRIDGNGNPNEEGSSYSEAVGLLYALSYTIKMSKLGSNKPDGYFEYTVPPLEGLWWMQDRMTGVDYNRKADFCWTAMIRQPEFVTDAVFEWACGEVRRKKQLNISFARFETFTEGLCVQCMHIGSFDNEPETVEKIEKFIEENGYQNDITDKRRHHEIYLSDPRKCDISKMKTVLRIPVKKR